MADSSSPLVQIATAQSQKEVTVNNLVDALSPAAIFGRRAEACALLTWGYYGGRWGGTVVANGTLTLDASDDTYIVADRSTGAVSASTATTNWDDTSNYARLYLVTTDATTVTAYQDHRVGPDGVYTGGVGATTLAELTDVDLEASSDAPDDGDVLTYEAAGDRWVAAPSAAVAASTVSALSSSSGVVNIDCALGDYFTIALTEDVSSITFSNLPGSGKGATKFLRITQDATPRTVAWPASFKWAGGAAGAVSAGSGDIDLLAISTFDNGTAWMATLAAEFA